MTIADLTSNASTILAAHFGNADTAETETRLPETTRRLAAKYLAGDVGATMRTADFALDEHAATLSLVQRYAAAVELIARQAPLRIDADEHLLGAATLLEACWHQTPASSITARNEGTINYLAVARGEINIPGIASTSHVTIGFDKVLQVGYRGLRAQIEARQARGGLDAEQQAYLSAMLTCLNAAQIWQQRNIEALEQLRETLADETQQQVDRVLAAARPVPESPPHTFHEALQSLWCAWTFQRLCGNWSGLGRLDQLLGPFLQRDLDEGRLNLDDARDLLAHFWIKGCEWIGAQQGFGNGSSGDAQYYQNVILGGIDAQGKEVANAVTYLTLDIVDELHISDFPIAVRVSERTPQELWRKIAIVQRHGGGIVSIYNEDLVIRALTRFGFAVEEAREFTNDGCWEVLIPGRSSFAYYPFDTLVLLQDVLGIAQANEPPQFNDFDELYHAFVARLRQRLAEFEVAAEQAFINNHITAPLLSLLVDDCIETARDYHQRGARYCIYAPHAGGLPDVANSLHVINKLVFTEQRASLDTVITAMRNNWVGYRELQRQCAENYPLYGNADTEADSMLQRVYDDYVALVSIIDVPGVLTPPGISTFGREIQWRGQRLATAFGRPAHAILAGNLSPTPGTEQRGITAVINSYCRFDYEKLPNGVPLDVTLSPSALRGDSGLDVLIAILRTFVHLGGWYLQVNVIDRATLRNAQQHPQLYPNLTVRISGWSARFATLNPEWQEMIIQRAGER